MADTKDAKVPDADKEFLESAKTKVVDDGLASDPPVLLPPGQNDNGGNDAVLTAK